MPGWWDKSNSPPKLDYFTSVSSILYDSDLPTITLFKFEFSNLLSHLIL